MILVAFLIDLFQKVFICCFAVCIGNTTCVSRIGLGLVINKLCSVLELCLHHFPGHLLTDVGATVRYFGFIFFDTVHQKRIPITLYASSQDQDSFKML